MKSRKLYHKGLILRAKNFPYLILNHKRILVQGDFQLINWKKCLHNIVNSTIIYT